MRDALQQKVKHGDSDTFVMLVVERMGNTSDATAASTIASAASTSASTGSEVVGVMDVSLASPSADIVNELVRQRLLSHHKEALVCYCSSMAVSQSYRRQGVASLMLRAAKRQARWWGAAHIALYVHQDNSTAVSLQWGWIVILIMATGSKRLERQALQFEILGC